MFLDSLGFLETHASRVQTLEGKKKTPTSQKLKGNKQKCWKKERKFKGEEQTKTDHENNGKEKRLLFVKVVLSYNSLLTLWLSLMLDAILESKNESLMLDAILNLEF